MDGAPGSVLFDVVRTFSRALRDAYAPGPSAQPEDQLKAPVRDLLRDAGAELGREGVRSSFEARVPGVGRPDVAVSTGSPSLLVGHVELKEPGKGATPSRFRGHDKRQWGKFRSLPNLVYTDGESWALFRKGERVGPLVRMSGDPTSEGAEAVAPADAEKLERLLREFLSWKPSVPGSAEALAATLAPLCHLLRDDVLDALGQEGSTIAGAADYWREYLFPDANNEQFADAYAQTVAYALLLARFSEAESGDGNAAGGEYGGLDVERAVGILRPENPLLARTLKLLAEDEVRSEISLGVGLLERSVSAVDPGRVAREGSDPWLYFYEDFLAAYDSRLRNDRGVYYTPVQVVRCQVRLVSELLEERFGKRLSYADRGVVVLDPACGTGTYPLAVLQHGLAKAKGRFGDASAQATRMGRNLHAFELLVGPYTVAHLKVTGEILKEGGELPEGGAGVYLTDTLEPPHASPPDRFEFFAPELGREHRRALVVKSETPVLVCIGNPPYNRHRADEPRGGWVRHGDRGVGDRPIIEDFLESAREAGQGEHLKNLYNDYVYFWRWALWKVFESGPEPGPGVVSFITASSYLRGPGFVGMREAMRRTFDELWVLDLEGGNLGSRKTPNVFDIQTPVAVAVGVRHGTPKPGEPAVVRYAKIEGSREEKLEALERVGRFGDLGWEECLSGWQDYFLPRRDSAYFSWPKLTDVFPWQHSGVQPKRTWPIGPTEEVLRERWKDLLSVRGAARAEAFKETRDRKIASGYGQLEDPSRRAAPLAEAPAGETPPETVRYALRSFNRAWILKDARLGDYMRPELWRAHGSRQVYMTSLITEVLGEGPSATVCADVPDLHHFFGRGGKDVIPLWRDAAASEPNVTRGLLALLSEAHDSEVSAEDLFCYAYALLCAPGYAQTFWDELTVPGPRIPLTKDSDLFRRVARAGEDLIGLHTFGERRLGTAASRRGDGTEPGAARYAVGMGIPLAPEAYPEDFSYDEGSRTLRVGAGEVHDVSPDVFEHSISGFKVVKSWLRYRMKEPTGRNSASRLDRIRPRRWTEEMSEELLELLWALEATVTKLPELDGFLEEAIASDLFSASELPCPAAEERESPKVGDEAGQASLFEERADDDG